MKKVLKPIEANSSDRSPFSFDPLLQSTPGFGVLNGDGTIGTKTGAAEKDSGGMAQAGPLAEEKHHSKTRIKSNRLRGRIETAKQIDQNFDQKETGSNDLMLGTDEFKALGALKSFLNIPAISLGLVNPVEEDVVDTDKKSFKIK